MTELSTIGLDLAKSVFQVHGVDLAFGEPFLEDVRGRLARRAVKSTAMPWPTEPAHQEHDDDNPTFVSGAKERHVDVAVRWARAIEDWDVGIAHFHGTSREPRLIRRVKVDGRTVLVPHYDQIDQTSLDLQLTTGAWLWKLEAMTRGGHGDRFLAAVGGFEYTRFGVFGTKIDLGLLAEHLYDGREGDAAPGTSADDDIFLGARLVLNDEQDTAVLAGATVDRTTQATLFFVEAERRLGDSWKIELESRLFLNLPGDDPLAGIRDDDFITLRLTKFF